MDKPKKFKPKQFNQRDLDKIQDLKNKAVQCQAYEVASVLRDLYTIVEGRVIGEQVDKIFKIAEDAANMQRCPECFHEYLPDYFTKKLGMCMNCVTKKLGPADNNKNKN